MVCRNGNSQFKPLIEPVNRPACSFLMKRSPSRNYQYAAMKTSERASTVNLASNIPASATIAKWDGFTCLGINCFLQIYFSENRWKRLETDHRLSPQSATLASVLKTAVATTPVNYLFSSLSFAATTSIAIAATIGSSVTTYFLETLIFSTATIFQLAETKGRTGSKRVNNSHSKGSRYIGNPKIISVKAVKNG